LYNSFEGLDAYVPNSLLFDVDRKILGEEIVVLFTWSLFFNEPCKHGNNVFLSISQALNNLFTLLPKLRHTMTVVRHVPFKFSKIVTCYAHRTYKELISNMFNNQIESKLAAMNIIKRSHGCYH
jgi:hypothetical protein